MARGRRSKCCEGQLHRGDPARAAWFSSSPALAVRIPPAWPCQRSGQCQTKQSCWLVRVGFSLIWPLALHFTCGLVFLHKLRVILELCGLFVSLDLFKAITHWQWPIGFIWFRGHSAPREGHRNSKDRRQVNESFHGWADFNTPQSYPSNEIERPHSATVGQGFCLKRQLSAMTRQDRPKRLCLRFCERTVVIVLEQRRVWVAQVLCC